MIVIVIMITIMPRVLVNRDAAGRRSAYASAYTSLVVSRGDLRQEDEVAARISGDGMRGGRRGYRFHQDAVLVNDAHDRCAWIAAGAGVIALVSGIIPDFVGARD